MMMIDNAQTIDREYVDESESSRLPMWSQIIQCAFTSLASVAQVVVAIMLVTGKVIFLQKTAS